MPRARTLLAGAAILAAGVVAGFWVSRVAPPAIDAGKAASSGVAEPPRAYASSGVTATARSSPLAPAAPARSARAASAPYLEQRYSQDRKGAFDQLAASTDPAMQAAAVDIADECVVFSDQLLEQTLANVEKRNLPARTKTLQRETIAQEHSRCAGFDTERILRAGKLRRALAKDNDLRMFASGMAQRDRPMPEVIATAQRAAASGDPLAILQAGMFFVARPDVVGGYEYDLGEGLPVPSGMLRDAFWLAACEYGADCSAGSPYVATKCVGAGYCGSASLEDLFATYNYPPAEAERLLAARQVVLNGLRTGQWPANFWNPQSRNVP